MTISIDEKSRNYACQVVKLPHPVPVPGLDNLVQVSVQGNSCLIGKDYDQNGLYLFFPAECKINEEFLSSNNLYRHTERNENPEQKGFFEDNGRVRAIKFKGIISSGFVIPVSSLLNFYPKCEIDQLCEGDEFTHIDGHLICEKYKKFVKTSNPKNDQKLNKINEVVDSIYVPEHFDTQHLLKNTHKFNLDTQIIVTIKLHGTSARYYNTLTNRKLTLIDRIAEFFGAKIQYQEYQDVVGSRRVIKTIGYEENQNKNHFYTQDVWSELGKNWFKGTLSHGEAVYCEIIGSTYTGEAIQHGYTYKLNHPMPYIYRISHIDSKGHEVDLPYDKMVERATELGAPTPPLFFRGSLMQFIKKYGSRQYVEIIDNNLIIDVKDIPDGDTPESFLPKHLEKIFTHIFYDNLLEKPSVLDSSVIEEGFCIRIEDYPKPQIYKIKSKLFLMHEGVINDSQEIVDIEEQQNV